MLELDAGPPSGPSHTSWFRRNAALASEPRQYPAVLPVCAHWPKASRASPYVTQRSPVQLETSKEHSTLANSTQLKRTSCGFSPAPQSVCAQPNPQPPHVWQHSGPEAWFHSSHSPWWLCDWHFTAPWSSLAKQIAPWSIACLPPAGAR